MAMKRIVCYIDPGIHEAFKDKCLERKKSMSLRVEHLIRDYLKDEGKRRELIKDANKLITQAEAELSKLNNKTKYKTNKHGVF